MLARLRALFGQRSTDPLYEAVYRRLRKAGCDERAAARAARDVARLGPAREE